MSLSQLSRADARNLVEFAKLDLGTTGGAAGCLSACDSSKPRKYYPSLYLDGKEDLPLPMKGKATIEYRITSKTRSQDDAGKISESARLEVLSIEPAAEPVKPAKAKLLSRADARNLVEFARGGYAIPALLPALKKGLRYVGGVRSPIGKASMDAFTAAARKDRTAYSRAESSGRRLVESTLGISVPRRSLSEQRSLMASEILKSRRAR